MSELDSTLSFFFISFFSLEMTGKSVLGIRNPPTDYIIEMRRHGFGLTAYINENQIYQNKILQLYYKSRPTASFKPCIHQKLDKI